MSNAGAPTRRIAAVALLCALTAAVFVLVSGRDAGAQGTARPNIVVIHTDDQDSISPKFMPKLQSLIVDKGLSFDNSIVNLSHCCPSRSTFLTGQYAKNHGVLTSTSPGGYQGLKPTLGNTLPVWLSNAGYKTGHVGHYLNGYKETYVPPGWTEFYGSWEAGAYGFTLNENGTKVAYGVNHFIVDPANYNTDVYSRKAADFIARRAPAQDPFFLYVGTFAPHTECGGGLCNSDPRAAPRHENAFATEPLPKPPNYNEADVSDKPQQIRSQPVITPYAEQTLTRLYRDRLESLLAVDDLIENVVNTLEASGELDNTVIMFSSDNGLLMGEHRWKAGKVFPYEESIRVPLMIRGPGIPEGAVREELVSNADLSPTILQLAGANPGRPQDGRSLVPLLNDGPAGAGWDRGILIEGHYNYKYEYLLGPRIVFNGVRTDNYMYARYENGEEELYDLQNDPFQMQSRHLDPAYAAVKTQLKDMTQRLLGCAGASCSAVTGGPPAR
jgi:arylsulfatase A-like enzyme